MENSLIFDKEGNHFFILDGNESILVVLACGDLNDLLFEILLLHKD